MNETVMKNLEERYLKELKRFLPFKAQKEILCTIRTGLHDYIYDHEIDNYEALLSGFGTPQETADNYLNESPSKVRSNANKTIMLVIILCIALMLFATGSLAYFYYEHTPAYIIEETAGEIDTLPFDEN